MRVTIPIRVFEHIASPYKVIDGEIIFFVEQACTTTNNLLKLHYIIYRSHQHNVAHIAGIYACTQFIRCRQDCWQQLFVVLEGSQRRFSHFSVISSHSLTIVVGRALLVLVHHITDYHGMFLSGTEDDGLFVWINLA